MNVQVYRIGVAAVEALTLASTGTVQGVTSRGAFLRVQDRIIYLTQLDYRSPFNLTLAGGDQRFERLEPGDTFAIDHYRLHFPSHNLNVITSSAEVWQPPAPVVIRSTIQDQYKRAQNIAVRLRQLDAQKGYLFLAEPEVGHHSLDQQQVVRTAISLLVSFTRGNKDDFLQVSSLMIGSGGGLTPSGDDFLAGFFLYHFRRALSTGNDRDDLKELCAELTAQSFQRTTTISANRLMFTSLGWSEDVFLALIDHLFDPTVPFDDDAVNLLMQIGHSSGVDTFIGIFYAIISLVN